MRRSLGTFIRPSRVINTEKGVLSTPLRMMVFMMSHRITS